MRKVLSSMIISAAILATGCTTNPHTGEEQVAKGAMYGGLGALGGATVGALVGGKDGALLGAALGGAAGAGYGVYTDVQEKKLREQLQGTGVGVEREGENILLTMPGNITFKTNDYQINSSMYSTLNAIAITLKEYPKSTVKVVGHTDNTGTLEKNQVLSENRAKSVADYLIAQGVSATRLQVYGVGPRQPVADNTTDSGRQSNRRVELEIIPTK